MAYLVPAVLVAQVSAVRNVPQAVKAAVVLDFSARNAGKRPHYGVPYRRYAAQSAAPGSLCKVHNNRFGAVRKCMRRSYPAVYAA